MNPFKQSDQSSTPPLRGMLAALSMAMLLAALGTSIANVGLPRIAHDLGADFGQVQWVVLAYLLAVTTLVVPGGRLGDLLGRRRVLLAGIAVFSAASLACAAAPDLTVLLAARAVQGAGAALMMALTMPFVAEHVPKARAGRAMGLLGTMSAVGTACGPTLGGALVSAFGWPALFAATAPVGLLTGWLAARHLPPDGPRPAEVRFDPAGTAWLALTLAAYALAMTTARAASGAAQAALLATAMAGLVAFVIVERRAKAPLIRPALLRDPVLAAGLASSALVTTVMMATLVVGPFYLARALALDATAVGLVMGAGPVTAALVGVPAGRLVDRFGAARVGRAGLIGMAAGAALLAVLPTALGVAGYGGPLVALTAGYAAFQAANNTAVMADVAAAQRGVISGLLNLSRNLGLVTGASAMGAVFALGAGPQPVMLAAPDAVAHGLRVTFGVATVLVLVAVGVAQAGRRRTPRAVMPARTCPCGRAC